MINLIFFGTPGFAVPSLRALHKTGQYKITVITAPDKPAGRKGELLPPPVKVEAQNLRLEILQPAGLRNEEFFSAFSMLQPSVAVVAAYGKIIPEDCIAVPKYGFVNVHPSLLPKYRGPSPMQGAIMLGEKETGVSIMLIDKEVDHGDVLAEKKYDIAKDKYFPEIADELAVIGAELLAETLPHYLHGELKAIPQDHEQATYTARLTWQDGEINWKNSAEDIYNRIRGLNPEPGTWTVWGNKTLRLLRARPLPFCVISTGTFGHVAEIEKQIVVQTGSCPLELLEIQLEGARPMQVKDFINGHPDFLGSQLGKKLQRV